MLHPDEWLAMAQRVPVGAKRRVYHAGEHTKAMDVWNNADSWSAYCHRCHESGRVAKTHQAPAVVQEAAFDLKVPDDILPLTGLEQHVQAHVWRLLVQKGCPPGVIPDGVLGYSKRLSRLCLMQGGKVLGRATRAGQLPKWVAYGNWRGAVRRWSTLEAPGDTLVLTEDALSAYKVAAAVRIHNVPGCSVMATLGTSLPNDMVPSLRGKRVLCMYDGDEAGAQGYARMNKRLRVWGAQVLDTRPAEGDPKDMSLQSIAETIVSSQNVRNRNP